MKKLKIVLIGAGSASFGRGAIVDIMHSPGLREFDIELSLVDINEDALKRMLGFAQVMKEHFGASVRISAATDRTVALRGAHYVIVSVARDRWMLWQKDFYIPAAYGFPQVFGENGGPGAAFHTLRSLHLMLPIAQDVERICPEALILNFTNPESRVCLGISRLTKARVIGLCHGVFSTLTCIESILGRPRGEIELTIGGLNHFHWALEVTDAKTGVDLRPALTKGIQEGRGRLDPLVKRLYELYGYLTYPAGSHPGEYVSFAHALIGPDFLDWGIGEVSRRPADTVDDRAYVLEGTPDMPSYEVFCRDYAGRIHSVGDRGAKATEDLLAPTDELAVPIILDIELDRKKREISVNLLNTGGAVSNLPEDAVVEVPAIVDAGGARPVVVGSLPEPIAGLCALQVSIQKLLVEAYRQRSKRLLLQALTIDPVVNDSVKAEQMMNRMLRIQADYLPRLT